MKTGLIGLGAMGMPMALNLHRCGYLHSFWNRNLQKRESLTEETGVQAASDIRSVGEQCELVILSVTADDDVLEVIDQLAESMPEDGIVVDTSTINAATAKEAASRLSRHHIHFLDAPVSGGVEGAKKGTLSMMVGGDKTILERVWTILECISSRIVHMGPVGNGQATKAVNQVMVAGINQAVTEALSFAQALGLPMDKVVHALGSGAAGNWFLSHRGPTMISDTFEPGFKVALHDKDLAICQMMTKEKGVELPVIERTRQDYKQLIKLGYSDEDISSLYRLKKQFFEK